MVLPVFPRNIPNRARPKSPPFQFFSALRDIFFRNFFFEIFSPKGPPCIFWCFATEWMLKNLKGSPLLVFFRHCEIFFPKMKKKFLQFFHVLRQNGCRKTSKGPPFIFSALWDFSAPLGPFFWVCKFFEKFSIFEYCKRILDTWKSFCYFWALDMAPTWAGPGLFKNTKNNKELKKMKKYIGRRLNGTRV